jgi:ABC-type branched-subunit amino acid transport system substrate-binding protein
MGTRTSIWAAGAALVTMLGSTLIFSPAAGAASPADEGVTAKTIAVGLPYVNFQALKSLGVTINDGNFPDAYQSVIADINKQGGINGRKLVLSSVEMNPSVPADATSSCTQLTEDDHVFVAISPVFPACYQQTHDTSVIAGSLPEPLTGTYGQDFTLIPPSANFDPIQLAAFKKAGDFKGKKVAIFYGADSDAPEVKVVQSALKKLGVPVALTAEDSVQATDAVASDQETQSISQRFQSAGVNVVIGVGGSGSTTWPRAQLDNQSTYKPTFIATSQSSLLSYVESTKGANPYLKYALAALAAPSNYQQWKDPAIKKCAADYHKAYPSDPMTAPVNPTSAGAGNTTDTSYEAILEACQYLGLFDDIATAAGKNLTTASFTKAGYALKNATVPGIGVVSFGPNQPYAIGPVTIYKYSPTSETLVPASS